MLGDLVTSGDLFKPLTRYLEFNERRWQRQIFKRHAIFDLHSMCNSAECDNWWILRLKHRDTRFFIWLANQLNRVFHGVVAFLVRCQKVDYFALFIFG